ncbi:GNAT family N-acetyltransferase [Bradyrhizobium diazoefficiens]|uniref:GNAT family N-acetyltransferase n=1 Tax=Bradyrhizobium diazoefficiens TaxID=1355477 RepID=UPI0035129882
MTDPSTALTSFQQALLGGEIELQRGALDPNLYVYSDNPEGVARLTYVRLDGKTVTAFASFVICDPIDGTPCFQLGYAVPEAYRNRGHAKDVVTAAIAEMRHGFKRAGIPAFHVEAIVGADNAASLRVAEQTISTSPTAITDQFSGVPAFQYVRQIAQAATDWRFKKPAGLRLSHSGTR